MILRIDGQTWCGAVADLRETDVDGAAVAAAVRGGPSPCSVHCPPPRAVHDRVGYVGPGTAVRPRTALAAAGRSRGLSAPQDDELATVRADIASLPIAAADPPETPTAPEADRDRLRERVAELRGRVQALESCDRDASDERERLREAARRLSELETGRVAAEQRRTLVRERRNRRERRLALEDRAANLERAARAHLVDGLADEYAAAVDALAPRVADPFDADPVTAALAVARVAEMRAPVVLAVDRFEGPAAAARWLDAPVVRL